MNRVSNCGKHFSTKKKNNNIIKVIIILILLCSVLLSYNFIKNENSELSTTIASVPEKVFLNSSNTYTEPIKSLEIENPGYDENNPGSWHVDKSAEWTSLSTARIDFDVNSVLGYTNMKMDVVLVIDASYSMRDSLRFVLEKCALIANEVKSKDPDNRLAIISFSDDSIIRSYLDKNMTDIVSKLYSISYENRTNYYAGFKATEEVLKDYEIKDDTDLRVVFLTDGCPNIDHPAEVGVYNRLKEKFPNIEIKGISYGTVGYGTISNELKACTDEQWYSTYGNLEEVLRETMVKPIIFEKYELVDYIDNDNFWVNSVNDINVTNGSVKLEEEDGKQKVVWTIDRLFTGSNEHMTINVSLKEQYVGNEGFYPTNEKEIVTSKLPDEDEVVVESEKTPVLQNCYKVIYDTNRPDGLENDITEEKHFIYENVSKSANIPTCDGYVFKGWVVTDPVEFINDNVFVMPFNDVHLKGIWSKSDISKSMDGTIREVGVSQFITGKELNLRMKQLVDSSVTDFGVYNNTIEAFSYNENIPNEYRTSEYVVSTQDSGDNIYMWYDTPTNSIYWGTDSNEKVQLNPDSSYFFSGLRKIATIDLTNIDTSTAENMNYFYNNCVILEDSDYDLLDTKNVTSMSRMFYNTPMLTNLDVKKLNFSNVTDLTYFLAYNGTSVIDLSEVNFGNVTDASKMFYGSKVTSVDLTNADLSKAENINSIFANCTSLTSVDFSGIKLDNVKDMSSLFYYCTSMSSVTLENLNLPNCENFQQMFSRCKNLKNVELNNIITPKLENMMNMFYTCSNLESVVLDIDTSSVKNMSQMFYQCSKLKTADLSSFDTKSVTSIYAMFYQCYKLETIYASDLFVNTSVSSEYVFTGCNNLVGGAGSTFTDSKITGLYARIDGGTEEDFGYFTRKDD